MAGTLWVLIVRLGALGDGMSSEYLFGLGEDPSAVEAWDLLAALDFPVFVGVELDSFLITQIWGGLQGWVSVKW